jgi:hypothetical protein
MPEQGQLYLVRIAEAGRLRARFAQSVWVNSKVVFSKAAGRAIRTAAIPKGAVDGAGWYCIVMR